MPYTLSVWALWMAAAAVIGLVIGWLLGRLRRAPEPWVAGDESPGRAAASPAPAATATAATTLGAVAPAMPSRAAEVERLRVKVAELEQIALERDRLEWELKEARAAAHAVSITSADAVFGQVDAADTSALAALTAERDDWASKAVAFEQAASELRVRVWNAEARVADLVAAQEARAMAPQAFAGAAGDTAPAAAGSDGAPARATSARTAPPRPDLEAGEAMLGGPLRFDDLTVVEGIGPQIAQLCVARGIDSWWAMANTDVDRLRRMLAAAGPRFQVQDPSSWPEQARLLAHGDWAGFKRLTHALRGGRSVG